MTKWILIFSLIQVQVTATQSLAKEMVSSSELNKLIEDTTLEQLETTHILWNQERIKDYLRRKRTLQNTKTMIADSATRASDEYTLSQKLTEN